jgi:hypothetical protein
MEAVALCNSPRRNGLRDVQNGTQLVAGLLDRLDAIEPRFQSAVRAGRPGAAGYRGTTPSRPTLMRLTS